MSDLPAGRELDALVAEKVMGWEWFRFIRHYALPRGREWWRALRNPETGYWKGETERGEFGLAQGDEPIAERYGEIPPPYSTSIAAAWELVEKFLPHFRLECAEESEFHDSHGGFAGVWHCDIWTTKGLVCVQGDTAPVAICRGALKAVGA